ncbi:hypothetical protein ACE4RR_00185 [Alteribacillus sp. HJP-4]
MGRAAAEDHPGVGFARLAEALPTESEGLVPCIFTIQKGASIIYDTAPFSFFVIGRGRILRTLVLLSAAMTVKFLFIWVNNVPDVRLRFQHVATFRSITSQLKVTE